MKKMISLVILVLLFFNNVFLNFSIFSLDIPFSVKLIAKTSVLTIECFQHLKHSISIFIVVHAAYIISTFVSLIDSQHSGHFLGLHLPSFSNPHFVHLNIAITIKLKYKLN